MDFINKIKWYHIVIILLIIGFIIIMCKGNNGWQNAPMKSEGFGEQEAMTKKPTLPAGEIILYYAMWCGYSRAFVPEWEKFEGYAKSNLPQLKVSKIRCEDGNEETCVQKGIQGYPTVVLYLQNGGEKKFDGQRNLDGLIQFIKQNM